MWSILKIIFKITIFKILITSLLISAIWLAMSCGSRKVQVNKSKEETKTETKDNSVTEKQIDTNVKTETKITVDDKNETVIEETTYSPSNPDKESFVIEKDGTKVTLNNAIKTVKKTTQKNNTKSQTFGNSEVVQKEAVNEHKSTIQVNTSKKENKLKEVDKKAFNPLWLLLILIPIFLIWVLYRIYKKLPIVPKI